MTELITRRLVLRTTDLSDAEVLAQLAQRESVDTYIGRLSVQREGSYLFTVLRKGTRLGQVSIIKSESPSGIEYEIVCALLPEAEGCGVATEACKHALAWACEEKALNRVLARVHESNEPSAQLVSRLGMHAIGSDPEKHITTYAWSCSPAT